MTAHSCSRRMRNVHCENLTGAMDRDMFCILMFFLHSPGKAILRKRGGECRKVIHARKIDFLALYAFTAVVRHAQLHVGILQLLEMRQKTFNVFLNLSFTA